VNAPANKMIIQNNLDDLEVVYSAAIFMPPIHFSVEILAGAVIQDFRFQ
jgi:hypothetical protein